MPFKISIHDDVSLSDLLDIHKNGGVVLKTPHVGNIYPNNLAVAYLGIPMLFYDRTLGNKDLNFHPHKIILRGRSEVVARADVLTTHSKINNLPQDIGMLKPTIGSRLSDFHMLILKKAIPEANCFTYTEYIQSNKERILELLQVVTNLHPHLWMRVVSKDGMISKAKALGWEDIIKLGVYGLTNLESGWIIPNPVNILFHGTIDAVKNKTNNVYLLSGPDMYQYIGEYQKELNEIYDYIGEVLHWNLPDTINCHIVPVISMRFIVDIQHKDLLDKLMLIYFKYTLLEDSIRGSSNYLNEKIKEKEDLKKEIIECISEGLSVFRQTVFYNIKEGDYFSQYDLIERGKLYIHPWAICNKLSDVSKAFDFLNRFYLLVKAKKKFSQNICQ